MGKHPTPMNAAMLDAVAGQFRALSEPARLSLLQRLLEGERSVGELVEASGLSQANVSKHLTTLTIAGFLVRRKDGTSVIYALADEVVPQLCDLMCKRVAAKARDGARALDSRTRAG